MLNDPRNRFNRRPFNHDSFFRDMEDHRRMHSNMRSAFPFFFGFVFLLIVGIFIANIVWVSQGRNPCDNPFNTRDYRCIGYYNHNGQPAPVVVTPVR